MSRITHKQEFLSMTPDALQKSFMVSFPTSEEDLVALLEI
jgi:hypothetical protein